DDINNQNVYTTAWYYLDADGKPLTGPQTFGNTKLYFLPNGAQVKGRFAPDGHYYDKDSGALVTNSFVHVYNWNYRNLDGDRIFHFTITIPGNDIVGQDGQYPRESKDLDREDFYYYVDAKGNKLTGPQTLNGIHVYFDQNGRQLRGEFKFDDDGTVHYYDAKNGARAENTIVRTNTGAFKFDANGNGHLMKPGEEIDTPVTPTPTVSLDNAPRVFGGHYYSDNEGNWYYKDANGKNLIGLNFVDNIPVYFDKDGKQVKGQEREIGGKYYRFDENDGSLLTNQWHHTSIFNGYRTEPQYTTYTNYLGEDGAAFIGWHTIDSKRYYFKPDGLMAKNDTVTIDGKIYLFDYQGQLVKNKYGIVETPSMFHANTSTYRTNANGEVLTGKQIIDGKEYIFALKGQVLDGIIGYDSKLYLVTDSKIEKNYFGALFSKKTFWGGPSFSGIYGTDKNGVLLEGIQRGSDGYLHYFQPKVESINKPTWKEIDGKRYRLTKSYRTERYAGMYTTIILTNDTLKVDDKTYTIDNEGVVTEFTAKNQFVRDDFWNWYYYDKEGKLLTGRQTIDGVQLYFDKNGKQVKGSLVDIDGKTYYFDKDSGAMWTNTTLEKDGKTYIIDENGVATEKVN
ncbi:MAG: choline-binding protein, partial [Streptococcus sp.]|nr:choline-binding protein [Streptococcus sp.]